MSQQLVDRQDQDFVIWEQINCAEILSHEKYREFNPKTCSLIINEARALAIKELLPLLAEGDTEGLRFENGARMSTGLQAMTYASSAYLLAVNYARERIQGRDLENFADHSAPSVPIIKHPDVRRNLLWMKSYVDGMRSFFYYMTATGTRGNIAEKEEDRERHADLFSMLTPVVKDYMAIRGNDGENECNYRGLCSSHSYIG
jgi:alkylation response protein AidB-like acyl-CoA dehydrogenase